MWSGEFTLRCISGGTKRTLLERFEPEDEFQNWLEKQDFYKEDVFSNDVEPNGESNDRVLFEEDALFPMMVFEEGVYDDVEDGVEDMYFLTMLNRMTTRDVKTGLVSYFIIHRIKNLSLLCPNHDDRPQSTRLAGFQRLRQRTQKYWKPWPFGIAADHAQRRQRSEIHHNSQQQHITFNIKSESHHTNFKRSIKQGRVVIVYVWLVVPHVPDAFYGFFLRFSVDFFVQDQRILL